jgi:hypothetical protein
MESRIVPATHHHHHGPSLQTDVTTETNLQVELLQIQADITADQNSVNPGKDLTADKAEAASLQEQIAALQKDIKADRAGHHHHHHHHGG